MTPVELRYDNGAKHADDDANPLQFFCHQELEKWCTTNSCGRNVIVLTISRQNNTSAVIFLKGESKEAFNSFFYTTAQSEWASERIPFPKRWSKYVCRWVHAYMLHAQVQTRKHTMCTHTVQVHKCKIQVRSSCISSWSHKQLFYRAA